MPLFDHDATWGAIPFPGYHYDAVVREDGPLLFCPTLVFDPNGSGGWQFDEVMGGRHFANPSTSWIRGTGIGNTIPNGDQLWTTLGSNATYTDLAAPFTLDITEDWTLEIWHRYSQVGVSFGSNTLLDLSNLGFSETVFNWSRSVHSMTFTQYHPDFSPIRSSQSNSWGTADTRHLVCGLPAGAAPEFYANGTLLGNSIDTGDYVGPGFVPADGTHRLQVSPPGSTTRQFGKWAIYNRLLTSTEIAAHYQAAVDGY